MFARASAYVAPYRKAIPTYRKVLHALLIIALGIGMGYGAEALDAYMGGDALLCALANMGNLFSVWIFLSTMLSYFSRGPIVAGLHVFAFLVAMCISYFVPKTGRYGYPIGGQLVLWCVIALVATLAAISIWCSRIGGWKGVVIKAMPIAAMGGEAVALLCVYIGRANGGSDPLLYVMQPDVLLQLGFYAAFIAVLSILLPSDGRERLRTGMVAVGAAAAFAASMVIAFA